MTEARHTPGPWEAGFHPANNKLNLVKPVVFGASVTVLPECEGGHVALHSAADARLIAAAPDMLAALLACREYWRDEEVPCLVALHDQVTDAIFKATGSVTANMGEFGKVLWWLKAISL